MVLSALIVGWLVAAPASGNGFAADRLRLAETYLEAGEPVAAIAPLLEVLRRSDAVAAGDTQRAKLQLAEAYVELGLFGSAGRLIDSLAAPEAQAAALRLRLKLAVRAGWETPRILAALGAYSSRVKEVDDRLILEAGRAAFLAPVTGASLAAAATFFGQDKRPAVRFFRGVLRLRSGDLVGAFEEFEELSSVIDPVTDRELYDQVHLALGRIYYEAGEYAKAERLYAAVGERSTAHDAALYETAWLYWSQKDRDAAAGNLLRLVVDYPFSPLVPKAQVFYGYLMLQRGDFAAAERSFATYIGRYTSLVETVAELNAIADDDVLFERLYGEIDKAIATGQGAIVEVGAWLQANPRMAAADRMVAKLRRAEAEIVDAARTLREVQTAAETEDADVDQREAEIAELRKKIDELSVGVGERLDGRTGQAFDRLQAEIKGIEKLRLEARRLRRHAVDRRREVISLLQYADAGRWAVWSENGKLRPDAVTEPVWQGRLQGNQMLERLDKSERSLLRTERTTMEIERRALQTRSEMVLSRLDPYRRQRLLALQDEYARVQRERFAENERRMKARLDAAAVLRTQTAARIAALMEHRAKLIALSHEAVAVRGRVAREEIERIESRIGALLVHARLGDADVAWEARKRARERAAAVARREQADMEALQSFYKDLAETRGETVPEAPAPMSGSTHHQAAAALARVAESYERSLSQVGDVLRRRQGASAQLAERLRQEGYEEAAVGRADAAGVLIAGPLSQDGDRPIAAVLYIDGRRHTPLSQDVMLDAYFVPGSHQIDAALSVRGPAGEIETVRGTLHVRLRRAEGYRIRLAPVRDARGLRLDFKVEQEGE